jgi:hypothetical protein
LSFKRQKNKRRKRPDAQLQFVRSNDVLPSDERQNDLLPNQQTAKPGNWGLRKGSGDGELRGELKGFFRAANLTFHR